MDALDVIEALERRLLRRHHVLEVAKLNQEVDLARVHLVNAVAQFQRRVIVAPPARLVWQAGPFGVVQVGHHAEMGDGNGLATIPAAFHVRLKVMRIV